MTQQTNLSQPSECALCGVVAQLDENHYCPDCQAEIAEANSSYQAKPRTIDWGMIFSEDSTATLNTFYSGVEA